MFPERGLDGRTWWLWHNVFGFQRSLNPARLFGLGQGYWPVFAALSVAAAVAIFVWLFFVGAARDWLLCVAMGLVTAGILGNLYDRLALHGLGPDGLPGSLSPSTWFAISSSCSKSAHGTGPTITWPTAPWSRASFSSPGTRLL